MKKPQTNSTAPSQKVRCGLLFVVSAILLQTGAAPGAEKRDLETLLAGAKAAYDQGNRDAGLMLATQAIAAEPKNPLGYIFRARFYEDSREPAKAVADYDQVLKLDPAIAQAWQHRGSEQFKLGRIKESIADFDMFIELMPQQAPHHWQRGIALYYAGRFEDGRRQFESHQTVNSNDVENAVWHFLCVARASGLERARAALIPIKGDARIPMMEVHALFAGKAKPEDVLKAARADGTPRARLEQQLFYAHLYIGLFCEATGAVAQARENIGKAAGQYRTQDYMGDVAFIHWQLRWPKETLPKVD